MVSRGRRGKPTITDVARAGRRVESLVSLVMRGARHVSPERRAAVQQAAAALGYRPNAMARGLVQRRTRILGVLLPTSTIPSSPTWWRDPRAGGARGYRVLINTGNRVPAQEDEAIEALLQLRVDGLILAGVLVESRLWWRRAARSRWCWWDGPRARRPLDSVTNDD